MPFVTVDQQAERQHYDDWTEPVTTWARLELIKGSPFVTVPEIAAGALKLPVAQLDKSSQMRIARILRLNGWHRTTLRTNTGLVKAWTFEGGNVVTGNVEFS